MTCSLFSHWPGGLTTPCTGILLPLSSCDNSPTELLQKIGQGAFSRYGDNPQFEWQLWLSTLTISELTEEEIAKFKICSGHKEYFRTLFATKRQLKLKLKCYLCESKQNLRRVNFTHHKASFHKLREVLPIASGICQICRAKLSEVKCEGDRLANSPMEDEGAEGYAEEEECHRSRTAAVAAKMLINQNLQRQSSRISDSPSSDNHSSIPNSQHSISAAQKHVDEKSNYEKLVETVESISNIKMRLRAPVTNNKPPTQTLVNDVGDMVRVVVDTLYPGGSQEGRKKLVTGALDRVHGDPLVNKSLESLIEHYKSVSNKAIKRGLLSEISKLLTLKEMKNLVDSSITSFQYMAARKLSQSKVEFGTKTNRKRMKPNTQVRDRDIRHFTTHVLTKHTRDMAYGTKILRFSSGEKVKYGGVVIEAVKGSIIREYQKQTREYNKSCEPTDRIKIFSARTYYRWLKEVRWTKSVALAGLDSYTAAGFDALDTLEKIVDEAGILDPEKSEIDAGINDMRDFLKSDYKQSLEDESSKCGFHCEEFGLSQPDKMSKAKTGKKKVSKPEEIYDESELSIQCSCENHGGICSGCYQMLHTLWKLKEILAKLDNKWLCHKFIGAEKLILEYKKHLMRAIRQDKAKQDLIQNLSPNEVLIVMDFAMKFLPIKYREAQIDFFGKKGLSWHILVTLYKDSMGEIQVSAVTYLMGNIKQDWFTVVSNIEAYLIFLRENILPDLKVAHLRADNAGYYHNPALILSLPTISLKTGIEIRTFYTSEPGYGKDICDRYIALMKAKIREYQMTRENVTSEEDMCKALSFNGGVKGVSVGIAKLNRESEGKLKSSLKIENIMSMNNFDFKPGTVRVFRQYKIGKGKEYTLEEKEIVSTGMTVPEGYFIPEDSKHAMMSRESANRARGRTFPCPQPGCCLLFASQDEVSQHINSSEQHVNTPTSSNSAIASDRVKISWLAGLEGKLEARKQGMARRLIQEELVPVEESSTFAPTQGWALYERPPPSRLNVDAREYLVGLFQGGKVDRNRRVSPQEAETLLHQKFPTQEDAWLSVKQIKSLFSRLAIPDRDDDVSEQELLADYENAEAEEILHLTVEKSKMKMKERKSKS